MESAVLLNNTRDAFGRIFNDTENCNEIDAIHWRGTFANISFGVSILLIALAGIMGNGAVIIVSYRSETLKRYCGNLLVAYLAVIDFLTAILCVIPSGVAATMDCWPFGITLCKFQSFCIHIFIPATSGTLSLIAIERLIGVKYPLHYKTWITTKVLSIVCAINSVAFLSSAILCFIDNKDLIRYSYDELICFVDYSKADLQVQRSFFYNISLGFYIPGTIIGTCYAIIIITVRKLSNAVHPIPMGVTDRDLREEIQRDRNMQKTILSMIVVAGLYFAINFATIVALSCKLMTNIDVSPWLMFFGDYLMMASCATNPFIYGILRKDYRDEFKKLFKDILRVFRGNI